MESVDKLREWMKDPLVIITKNTEENLLEMFKAVEDEAKRAWQDGFDTGFASADDWLCQHEDEMAEHGWVKLPVDADGEPIHIGDVMDGTCPSGKHVNGTVSAIGDGVFWLSNVQFSLKPNYMHHHHEPTVEDVLREFADRVCNSGHQWGLDAADTIAEYAQRLRLAGDE
jgi:hypothetical protein